MRRGFTLIELVVGIAIIAVIIAISVSAYFNFLDGQRLSRAVEDTVSLIQKARNESISGNGNTFYGIRANEDGATNENTVIRFRGNNHTISSKVIDVDTITIENPVIISDVDFDGGSCSGTLQEADIIIRRVSGDIAMVCHDAMDEVSGTTTLSSGSITFQSARSGEERVITISPQGVIEVN